MDSNRKGGKAQSTGHRSWRSRQGGNCGSHRGRHAGLAMQQDSQPCTGIRRLPARIRPARTRLSHTRHRNRPVFRHAGSRHHNLHPARPVRHPHTSALLRPGHLLRQNRPRGQLQGPCPGLRSLPPLHLRPHMAPSAGHRHLPHRHHRPPAFSSRRSSGWRSEERLSSTDTTIAQTARPMKKYSATTGEEARSMMWPTTIGTVNNPMFCTQ